MEKVPAFAPDLLALSLILEPISAVTLLFPQAQPIAVQALLPSSLSIPSFDVDQLLSSLVAYTSLSASFLICGWRHSHA